MKTAGCVKTSTRSGVAGLSCQECIHRYGHDFLYPVESSLLVEMLQESWSTFHLWAWLNANFPQFTGTVMGAIKNRIYVKELVVWNAFVRQRRKNTAFISPGLRGGRCKFLMWLSRIGWSGCHAFDLSSNQNGSYILFKPIIQTMFTSQILNVFYRVLRS